MDFSSMTETDWIDNILHEYIKFVGDGFIIEYVLCPRRRIRIQ